MRTLLFGGALVALVCVGEAQATPPQGSARPMPPIAGAPPPGRPPGYGGGVHPPRPPGYGGGGYYTPRPPGYGGGWGYYGPRPGWYGGWYGGYWGPRVGVSLGTPWYWGGWPYSPVGYGWGAPYVWGAPYAYYYGTPWIVGSVATVPQEAYPLAAPAAPAPSPPAPNAAASYWYYCPQPQGYFPYVKDCAQGWLKVVPQVPGESNAPPALAP